MTIVEKECFGTTQAGQPVFRFALRESGGACARVLSYGATWQSMLVEDRAGTVRDVVLGYDTLAEYEAGAEYFGATIGRVANRIDGGEFSLNGKTHKLFVNDVVSCSHGGKIGFDRCCWDAEIIENGVRFSRVSPSREEGFPGNLSVAVSYTLRGGVLRIEYTAQTDEDTIVNLTNHSYFNLDGQGSVEQQLLQIDAESFTRIRSDIVPTGEIVSVGGTPLDFRQAKPIGSDVDEAVEHMDDAGGYDHNFVLADGFTRCASAWSPRSGIGMEVWTDQPGVQLYTPKDLGGMRGKGGARYGRRPAFCLETQHFADAPHHDHFPSVVLRAGERLRTATEYRFGIHE